MYKSIPIAGAGSGLGEESAIGLAKKGYSVIAAAQSWPQVRGSARQHALEHLDQRAVDPCRTIILVPTLAFRMATRAWTSPI